MMNTPGRIAIIGANGAIGKAMTDHLSGVYPEAIIDAFCRVPSHTDTHHVVRHPIEYTDNALQSAAAQYNDTAPLDWVIVTTGLLHEPNLQPEKSLSKLTAEQMTRLFDVNARLPALIAKHFLPQLNRHKPSLCAILSARVGSISDNRLGGWYSYRMAKAALNMFIKTASIELKRTNPKALIVGLHPGTVKSRLSSPFLANTAADRIFTPDFAALKLHNVITRLKSEDSGKCFAWDGSSIPP